MSLPRTPSQTVGPFFGFSLPWPMGPRVVPEGTRDTIHITGRLLDGDGAPVVDGLIETWQAGPDGLYSMTEEAARTESPQPSPLPFWGFGRSATDGNGRWEIWTLKPSAVRAPDGTMHAPHVAISVFARGLLRRLVTRMYFPDQADAAANAADPVLAAVDAAARPTLIAARAGDDGYTFDIRLQREGETVFFDV